MSYITYPKSKTLDSTEVETTLNGTSQSIKSIRSLLDKLGYDYIVASYDNGVVGAGNRWYRLYNDKWMD